MYTLPKEKHPWKMCTNLFTSGILDICELGWGDHTDERCRMISFSKYTFLMFSILPLGKFAERNTWKYLIANSQAKFTYTYHVMKMFTWYCLISKYKLQLLTWQFTCVCVCVCLSYTSLPPQMFTLSCAEFSSPLSGTEFSLSGHGDPGRDCRQRVENSRK